MDATEIEPIALAAGIVVAASPAPRSALEPASKRHRRGARVGSRAARRTTSAVTPAGAVADPI